MRTKIRPVIFYSIIAGNSIRLYGTLTGNKPVFLLAGNSIQKSRNLVRHCLYCNPQLNNFDFTLIFPYIYHLIIHIEKQTFCDKILHKTVLHGDLAVLSTRTLMRGAEPAVRLVRA